MNNESILSKLFPGRVIIPKEVYDELSHPGVNRVKGLKAQVDIMVQSGAATIETIVVGTNTYRLYRKLTNSPDPGHRVIGRGEAASISLAKETVFLPAIILKIYQCMLKNMGFCMLRLET